VVTLGLVNLLLVPKMVDECSLMLFWFLPPDLPVVVLLSVLQLILALLKMLVILVLVMLLVLVLSKLLSLDVV